MCAILWLRDKRQFFYVFDVCTHPIMVQRGLGKVVMDAVFRLGCVTVKNRMCDYWQQILRLNDPVWLLLEVNMEKNHMITRLRPRTCLRKTSTSTRTQKDFHLKISYSSGTRPPRDVKIKRCLFAYTYMQRFKKNLLSFEKLPFEKFRSTLKNAMLRGSAPIAPIFFGG
jgi:hypothetical protein